MLRGKGGNLVGIYSGLDGFLCCPGPSLAAVDAASLRVPGAVTFAMTSAYPAVRPDVWVSMDLPVCYDRRAWLEPFIKIARSGYQLVRVVGRALKDCPNTYFAEYRKGAVTDIVDAARLPFIWNRNTFLLALHVMVYMGLKRIRLVGCDFGGDRDYHDNRKLSEANRINNRLLMNQTVRYLPEIRTAAEARGIEILSCTENSRANQHLEYVPLKKAIEMAQVSVPPRGAPLLHSRDAELVKWTNPRDVTDGPGIVVGVASEQEDLLPWWYENFCSAGNKGLPLLFADFGMSARAKQWCEGRGKVADLTDVPAERWFRKPIALIKAPFRRIVWLDLDTEIRGDLRPLFRHADDGAIGLPRDLYAGHAERGLSASVKIYDPGLVVTNWGNDIIVEWAVACLARPWPVRGDQEMLCIVLHNVPATVSEIPPAQFSAWFDSDARENALVVHWCGSRGKQALRDRAGLAGVEGRAQAVTVGAPAVPARGDRPRRTLFSFWHGLGDNIIVSPAIRKYKQQTGDYVGWAMARCHAPAGLYEYSPHVDAVHYISTPWDHVTARRREFGSAIRDVHEEVELIASRSGYDRTVHVDLQPAHAKHKLLAAAEAMGVELRRGEMETEFCGNDELAELILRARGVKLPAEYVFFHGQAGTSRRRLSLADCKRLCRRLEVDLRIVCPDEVLALDRVPLLVSAYLLSKATHVVVTDSVMYHLAHATRKPIDAAFFVDRGVYSAVRPLCARRERVLVGRGELDVAKPLRAPVIGAAEFFSVYGSGDAPDLPGRWANTPLDRKVLLALCRHYRPKRVLEFGVGTGTTAAMLLANCPWIEKYHGLDVPSGFKTAVPAQQREVPAVVGGEVDDPRFESIVLLRGSADVEPSRFEKGIGFIFIDGDHSEEGVRRDTELAYQAASEGAVVCWHDYKPDENGYGVKRYLDELSRSGRAWPTAVDGSTVCFEVR